MGGARRRLMAALAVALVLGLTAYFVSLGFQPANTAAGPIGTVIGLIALLAQVFPKRSEEATVAGPARLTVGIKVLVGKMVHSPVVAAIVAVVAIVALGLATLVVLAVVHRGPSPHDVLGADPVSPSPSPSLSPSPSPLVSFASPTASPTPRPTRSSAAPPPIPIPIPAPTTPVEQPPLLLPEGAQYVALLPAGPKLVGKNDGPDVEVEAAQVDPLGMGIAAPDGAKTCGSAQWQYTPLPLEIATRPSYCVRSRLGDVWLLELEPTVEGPGRPRPYRATFTQLAG